MKYCPNCGKAGVEGMKFCPQCGQSIVSSNLEEEKTYVQKLEPPSKQEKWSERHPGWTLLLVIVGAPFITWGITLALIALAMLLPSSIGEAAAIGAITAMPLAYIAVVVMMVRWYKQKRKQSKTIADYAKTSGLHIDNADAYYNRGCTHGEAGEYEKAMTDYDKAIELNPNDADAYYNRGVIYSEKGEVIKAVGDLKRCIELSTDPELTKAAQQELYKMEQLP